MEELRADLEKIYNELQPDYNENELLRFDFIKGANGLVRAYEASANQPYKQAVSALVNGLVTYQTKAINRLFLAHSDSDARAIIPFFWSGWHIQAKGTEEQLASLYSRGTSQAFGRVVKGMEEARTQQNQLISRLRLKNSIKRRILDPVKRQQFVRQYDSDAAVVTPVVKLLEILESVNGIATGINTVSEYGTWKDSRNAVFGTPIENPSDIALRNWCGEAISFLYCTTVFKKYVQEPQDRGGRERVTNSTMCLALGKPYKFEHWSNYESAVEDLSSRFFYKVEWPILKESAKTLVNRKLEFKVVLLYDKTHAQLDEVRKAAQHLFVDKNINVSICYANELSGPNVSLEAMFEAHKELACCISGATADRHCDKQGGGMPRVAECKMSRLHEWRGGSKGDGDQYKSGVKSSGAKSQGQGYKSIAESKEQAKYAESPNYKSELQSEGKRGYSEALDYKSAAKNMVDLDYKSSNIDTDFQLLRELGRYWENDDKSGGGSARPSRRHRHQARAEPKSLYKRQRSKRKPRRRRRNSGRRMKNKSHRRALTRKVRRRKN